jgi:lipopolysaccharide/colanic/teichoic acid biosynthesis glycosyltransferase
MKNFLNMKSSLYAERYKIENTCEEEKSYSLFKQIETVEPFFVRRIPLWKRTLDIVGSLCGLIIFSPLFLAIAVLIKIVSPGPVIFKQTRIGYGCKEFKFRKFRTMRANTDAAFHQQYLSELIKEDNDGGEESAKPMIKQDRNNPNIIPFGHFLRCSCLDELPQLINVLLGEMSLVGPRPPIPYEVEEYLIWHRGRFDGLPGMTGLWQVSGKNRLSFKEMIRLDIQYERQMSLLTDLKILFVTPFAIMREYFYNRLNTQNEGR